MALYRDSSFLPSVNGRIERAIKATQKNYWKRILAMHAELSDTAEGSVVLNVTPNELESVILNARWQPYIHDQIIPITSAFWAPIPGQLGLINLYELEPDELVTLEDPKETGFVSAVVSGKRGKMVNFSIIILGPEEDTNGMAIVNTETIWTFHPGEPIRPSDISSNKHKGKTITAAEATMLGFRFAKIKSI